MTPAAAAALRDEASRLRAQADRLDAIADQAAAAPEGARAEMLIDTSKARRIAGVENSTLYRWARRYDLGRKVGGTWRFDETHLRAFVAGRGEVGAADGEVGAADGEVGAAIGIHNTPDEAHFVTDETKR